MVITDGRKKPLSTALYYGVRSLPIKALFARQLAHPMRGNKALQPEKFSPETEVLVRHSAASSITTIHSPSPKVRSDAHIIYLHGGGYAMQALFFHRRFAEKLAIRTGCTVSLLDFPLPPQAQCIETVCAVMRMYKIISLLYRQHRLILMGDSAGGGLALSLMQKLLQIPANNPAGKIADIRPPDSIILYSPWLDIRLAHREIEPHYAKKEAVLSLPALRQAGLRYAHGLAPDDPRCSLLYGQMEGLGRIQIFISEDELFYPDAMGFYEQAKQAKGTEIEMIIEKRRLHCWPLLGPAFEQENNFRQMARFCGLEVG